MLHCLTDMTYSPIKVASVEISGVRFAPGLGRVCALPHGIEALYKKGPYNKTPSNTSHYIYNLRDYVFVSFKKHVFRILHGW